MAWLIALALLLWIGGSIVKLYDASTGARAKHSIAELEAKEHERAERAFVETTKERRFLADVYVVAWSYYQKLEPQFYQAWIDKYKGRKALVPLPDSASMNQESSNIFGESIRHASIRKAIEDLVQYPEIRIYQWNNACKLTPVVSNLDVDPVAATAQIDSRIPCLGDFYHWDLIALRTGASDFIQSLVPERTDVRVYQYNSPVWDQMNGQYKFTLIRRQHVPEDYLREPLDLHKPYQFES